MPVRPVIFFGRRSQPRRGCSVCGGEVIVFSPKGLFVPRFSGGGIVRGVVVALGVSMAVAAGPAVASAAPDSIDKVPTPQLSWTDCQDGFQCAKASVPLDYD